MSNAGSTNSPMSLPLRSALRDDTEKIAPLSGHPKAVQIAEPDVSSSQAAPPVEEPLLRKQFSANVAKRLGGRPSVAQMSQSSRSSMISVPSTDGLDSNLCSSPMQAPADDSVPMPMPMQTQMQTQSPSLQSQSYTQSPYMQPHLQRRRSIDHLSGRLLTQVTEWIQREKAKKESRTAATHSHAHSRRSRVHGHGHGHGHGHAHEESGAGRSDADAEAAPAKTRGRDGRDKEDVGADEAVVEEDSDEDDRTPSPRHAPRRPRAPSNESASSEVSLDRLQRIIDDTMAAMGIESIANFGRGRGSLSRRHSRSLRYQPNRTASSDAEPEGDAYVPGCDAILDNSKTLSYAASNPSSSRAPSDAGSLSGRREEKERQAWVSFKNEIIRLAHTLRLKGWRRVPLDTGETISVERLSGALTNAVYVVSPPSEFVSSEGATATTLGTSPYMTPEHPGAATAPAVLVPSSAVSSNASVASVASVASNAGGSGRRSRPSKLLLRIYGPQVEHLIDREKELSVLRRLARKKIGPRLLGTFGNGRFEQYFNAMTLTPAHLREPETSKQIAKRMRELHDGIELLEEERNGGPAVWSNWDHWVDAAERTITYADRVVKAVAQEDKEKRSSGGDAAVDQAPPPSAADFWKHRGFVCGVEWPVFKAMAEKYREFIKRYYGDPNKIRDSLVFAHSDTQYGNILRIRPDDERSPLLQPDNEHKQLVVIDFEYSAANPPGIEFANHFTEWTYNYHDPVVPYACHPSRYPTPEQQRRFIRAYVEHQPEFPHQRGLNTPRFGPMSTPSLPPLSERPSPTPPLSSQPSLPSQTSQTSQLDPLATPPQYAASSASSIAEFMLDARVPTGGWKEEERKREELVERQVDELMAESRLWRPTNSAMWVVWGLVQAKVPGLQAADGPDGPNGLDGLDGTTDGTDGTDVTYGVDGVDGGISNEDEVEIVEEDGFDYLGYAQERAFFFWGDCVQAGLVRLQDLPADLQPKLKFVEY